MTPQIDLRRVFAAAALMPVGDARNVIAMAMKTIEGGGVNATGNSKSESTLAVPVVQSEGAAHYAKREKFINRIQSACDRVLDYAKHETLRNVEKHFRDTGMAGADEPIQETSPTIARITFKKDRFTEE